MLAPLNAIAVLLAILLAIVYVLLSAILRRLEAFHADWRKVADTDAREEMKEHLG